MNILIVGNGGREHALAWKIAQSPLAAQVFVAPGNAGTALEAKVKNIPISPNDITSLIQFAKQQSIDLTIIGPEAPLAAGIVDQFIQAQLRCLGPTQAAAQLESSKAFSKAFMQRHQIPTAHYACFTELNAAKAYVKKQGAPIVIKADGLAAGKGVVVAHSESEAMTALDAMLGKHSLGHAGQQVVIEEFLTGEEVSFIVLTDGKHILPFATSQDHKARDNGDQGPNTGGMGAYSPAPIITPALSEHILKTIIEPTIKGMAQEGTPYRGFLYAGLMISPNGAAKVLEFNCRLGDPETQPLLMRLESDLVPLCMGALNQQLHHTSAAWKASTALGVVLASKGYPEHYPTGDVISGLAQEENPNWKVFQAGTQKINDQIVTTGGRVLCVTALGKTISQAQTLAYEIIKKIKWNNIYYRTDIGYRAINREKNNVSSL